jgi:hypothetical protein
MSLAYHLMSTSYGAWVLNNTPRIAIVAAVLIPTAHVNIVNREPTSEKRALTSARNLDEPVFQIGHPRFDDRQPVVDRREAVFVIGQLFGGRDRVVFGRSGCL